MTMTLHWSPRSPYVRKVMITLHETGLLPEVALQRSVVALHLPPDLVYAVDAIVRLEHTPHLDLEDVIAAGSRPGVGTDHAAAPHAHDRSTGRSARPGRPARPHRPRYVHR